MRSIATMALGIGLLLLPAAAVAGPEAAPEEQLRAWVSGVTGLAVPELPLRITPEGEHYRLELPLPGVVTPDGPAHVTAIAHESGGRWSVEDLAIPPSMRFAMRMPDPADPKRTVPADAVLALAGPGGRMLIDPSAATPSTFEAHLSGLALDVEGGGQHQRQTIDTYETSGAVSPAADGRLDLEGQWAADNWRIELASANGAGMAVAIRRAATDGRIDGLSRSRFAPIVTAIAGLASVPRDDAGAVRAALHRFVEALRGSLRAGRVEERFEAISVAARGQQVGIDRLRLGLDAAAPGSRLGAALAIEASGIDAPTLPPDLRAWLPERIALRPSVSGVDLEGLTRIALAATAPLADGEVPPPDLAPLFAGPGITVAVDPLAVALQGAQLQGSGSILLRAPDRYTVSARLVGTGFDALFDRAQRDPTLRDALPFLILLRGLARPDGGQLVWEVSGDETGLAVNGTDLSALIPGQDGAGSSR